MDRAAGYQLQYSLNKKFSTKKKYKTKYKNLSAKNTTTISGSVTKLQNNKRYYARARAYKVINGKKYYCKWSSVVTAKTKKVKVKKAKKTKKSKKTSKKK